MSALTIPHPPPPRPAQFTPDDLLNLEQHGLFELVDGHLIKKPMGYFSGRTACKLTARLEWFLEKHPIGEVSSEVTFRCFPEKPIGLDLQPVRPHGPRLQAGPLEPNAR